MALWDAVEWQTAIFDDLSQRLPADSQWVLPHWRLDRLVSMLIAFPLYKLRPGLRALRE